MKKALLPLVLSVVFVAVLFLQSFYPFPETKDLQILDKADSYHAKFPQEKIYLHTDRSSYWSGDNIWFKAYLKDSPIPDCNLYVELLNSSGKVIQKKMYLSLDGLANGDFHLKDTLSSGVYQIRAYTNWMRNFDEQGFFRKDMVILNPQSKVPEVKTHQLKERDVDFQFFPEGGTYVNNLKSKMAFKATDPNGKGLEVKGQVVDDLGNKLIDFRSEFKGMGSFMIQPLSGRKYTAQVLVAGGIDMEIDLPVPQEEGENLSIQQSDSIIHAQISGRTITLAADQNAAFLLVVQSKGRVAFQAEVKLNDGIGNFDIRKDALPAGIVQFTLFDQNLNPLCERLVFVNRFESIDVEIKPDKESYLTREKVQLRVKAIPKSGIPKPANLSMSVFNPDNQVKTEDYPDNILTHFLLNSELKGLIEDPAYYFMDDKPSTLLALDNLMLTHGYRQFEWKAISEDKFPVINFPAEECIQIKGKVTHALSKKTVPNCKLTLTSKKGLLETYHLETDSLGAFLFSDIYFNDTIQFLLKAITQKGKQNNWIELDRETSVSPKRTYLPITYQYRADEQVNTISYLNEYSSDLIKRKWHLKDTIMLNEVRVVKSKYKFGERPMRLYDKADYELDLDTDDDELGNVFEHLVDKFSSVIVTYRPEGNLSHGSGLEGYKSWDILRLNPTFVRVRVDFNPKGPVYVLDGSVVDQELINIIPAGTFKKVEILKNGSVYGNFDGGAVCFFTKYGAFHPMPNSKGEKVFDVIGYSVIRKFYAPNYETPIPQEIKDDFRNTLYWNPILVTDTTGVANVSYYNSDQTGDVDVVVEGVTKDGRLCRGVCKYNVKN